MKSQNDRKLEIPPPSTFGSNNLKSIGLQLNEGNYSSPLTMKCEKLKASGETYKKF